MKSDQQSNANLIIKEKDMHKMSKMSIAAKFGTAKNRQNNRRSAGVRPSFHANSAHSTTSSAFTIVELLIVIVIIGILAAIAIVSYSGITSKANTAALQSDLTNASKKLSMYYAEYETYPTEAGFNQSTGWCPTLPNNDVNYCIKYNLGTIITYKSDNSNSYDLTFTKNGLTFTVSQSGVLAAGAPVSTLPESDWITIGTQRWARKNLDVGTRIDKYATQTNNGGTNVVEKYCYGNTDAGCTNTDINGTPYGGLYTWDEAMNYSSAEGAQGICPAGSHIPSDNDWKILEVQLGMAQAAADLDGWRGTDEATKLKSGGSSGLNVPDSGYWNNGGGGSYFGMPGQAFLWSSSESDVKAWIRYLDSIEARVFRITNNKNSVGLSVRCLGN